MQLWRIHGRRRALAAFLGLVATLCLTAGQGVAASASAPADASHLPVTADQAANNRAEQAAATAAARKKCAQIKGAFAGSGKDLKDSCSSLFARFSSRCSALRTQNMQDYMAWNANKNRCVAKFPELAGR